MLIIVRCVLKLRHCQSRCQTVRSCSHSLQLGFGSSLSLCACVMFVYPIRSLDTTTYCRHGRPCVNGCLVLPSPWSFPSISIRPALLTNFSASPIYSSLTSPPYRYFQPPSSGLLFKSALDSNHLLPLGLLVPFSCYSV
jgi:hypothetical protein